jgi:hypothetical protein
MKKILLAREKSYNRVFDISTKELENEVCEKLFKERRELLYYEDLRRMESKLYEKALLGDQDACRNIIHLRSYGFEYENVEVLTIENS